VTERSSENKKRFDALFAEHGSDVVAYCGWRAASASDAQDAVADVFLTAWRRLDDVPAERVSARVWLYATARRVIANQRRSNRRRSALHDRLAHDAAASRDRPTAGEASLVHDALELLGSRDREVLLLSEWEGLSAAEIAAVLGCLTVTARGRLHRARRRFRTAFEDLRDRDARRVAAAPRPGGTPDYSLLRQGGS
jgi:RNA polymerase sigma factor (sigma-70 family)